MTPLPGREGLGVGVAAGDHKECLWNCSASPTPTPNPPFQGEEFK